MGLLAGCDAGLGVDWEVETEGVETEGVQAAIAATHKAKTGSFIILTLEIGRLSIPS